MDQTPKKQRGFAAMHPEKQREIARRGGKSVPNEKRSFSFDPGLVVAAGRLGGATVDAKDRSFSRNQELASRAGKIGSLAKRTSDKSKV
jgi:general stress protein YciG